MYHKLDGRLEISWTGPSWYKTFFEKCKLQFKCCKQ